MSNKNINNMNNLPPQSITIDTIRTIFNCTLGAMTFRACHYKNDAVK